MKVPTTIELKIGSNIYTIDAHVESGPIEIQPEPPTPKVKDECVLSGLIGLGEKPSSLAYYDNFEDATVGPLGDKLRGLIISNKNGGEIVSGEGYSGSKCLKHNFGAEDFPKHYLPLSGNSRKIRVSCKMKITGKSGSATRGVWKFARAGFGDAYSGNPSIKISYVTENGSPIPAAFSGEIIADNGDFVGWSEHNKSRVNPKDIFIIDRWHHCEWLFDFGTITEGASVKERINGFITTDIKNKNVYLSGVGKYPTWVMTPITGFDSTDRGNVSMLIDELLIDESWCAWVTTDSANYSSSTIFTEQVITKWSDNEAKAIISRGALPQGSLCYHHLFNNGANFCIRKTFSRLQIRSCNII